MSGKPQTAAPAEPYAFALRMALLYSVYFAFVGVMLPFFPVWLKDRGLSETQIGIILSLPMLVRIFTSGAVSAHADRMQERANVVIVLMSGTAFSLCLFLVNTQFWPILAIALLLALFSHPLQPVMDSITLLGVRRHGHDYGRIRLWGSVVFIIANLAGGAVLAQYGSGAVMWLIVACAFAGMAVSPATPRLGPARRVEEQNQLSDASVWKLVQNQRFMLITVGCGIVQATHAMIYAFGSIHWGAMGFSGTLIGMLWAIGVVAEIVLFQFSRQVFRRVTATQLAIIGALACVVRWGLMPLEPGIAGFAVLQLLHGLSFGATHLGLMHYYVDTVPETRMGSAQAVGFVIAAIAMGSFSFLSGPLYAALGINAFGFMAIAGGAGLALLLIGQKLQPHNAGVGGKTLPSA